MAAPWGREQIGYTKLPLKVKAEQCKQMKLSFKGVLWSLAARGYAGAIGEPHPKQSHFRCVPPNNRCIPFQYFRLRAARGGHNKNDTK